MTVTIYHNAACGTSRNVLGLIRNSGEEPHVIEYLKTDTSKNHCAGAGSGDVALAGGPWRAGTATTMA